MQPNGPPQPPPQPGLPQFPPPQSPPRPPSPPQPWPCPWPSWSSCCHGIPGVSGKDGVALAMPDPSPRAANPIVPATANTAAIALSLIMRPLYAISRLCDICSEPFWRSEGASGYGIGQLSASNLANATPYRDGSRSSLVYRRLLPILSRFGHGHMCRPPLSCTRTRLAHKRRQYLAKGER